MYVYAVLLLPLLCVNSVFSENILFVAPLPSLSHHIWNRILAEELAKKGHNVTYIGADNDSSKIANYSNIVLEGTYEKINEHFSDVEMNILTPMMMLTGMQMYTLLFCEHYSETEGLKKILSYPEDFKFDLIIFDVTAGGCLYPMIQKFKYPPTVGVTPFLLPPYIANSFGNHLYPAYVPWYGFSYSQNMSFSERVWNFLFSYLDIVVKHPRFQTTIEDINKKIFGKDAASAEEIEKHISVILVNTDPVLDYPQPLAPNIIPVGGLHARPSKKLPQNLQTILDNAKNGAIIFSLGTNLRSDQLDNKTKEALLSAFSKIKETIIWKFESELDNLPKNVIVRKFLPQNDLLGHANVKLFIGHGGALSTQEAMYHGLPMIAVPFFMDQHLNAKNIVERKLGLSMDFKKITANYVLQNVREVLDNPLYAQNMKKVSQIFKDKLETPLEKAVFWTEYAMRYGGAKFLTTPARDLPFYVSSGLDVVAFLALLVVLVLLVIIKIVKACGSLLRKTKKEKVN